MARAKVGSTMYKPGYFVLQSSLLPLFGEVKDIVFSVYIYIFCVTKYRTECFLVTFMPMKF